MVAGKIRREIVGFEFNSYGEDLVKQILVKYLSGSSLEQLSLRLEGVSYAQAQRIVDAAIVNGVLLPEDKHAQGCPPTKLQKANEVLLRRPNAKPKEIARLVGCGETTVWRARKRVSE